MQAPITLNLKVYQGTTFTEVLRWEGDSKVYIPITNITKSAPILIETSVDHLLPESWRVKVTNVLGMLEINSTDVYHNPHVVSTTSIELNKINALAFKDYVSGGVLEYNEPVDLTGFTARMQLRSKISDEVVILELTTENGGILIDNVAKTISIVIDAVATALLDFSTAVYSLELVKAAEVTSFIRGNISLEKEVTR